MKRSWLIPFLIVAVTQSPLRLCASAVNSISSDDATNAILGEAAGQPYIVKLGIADAIHNRADGRGGLALMKHPLHGVYGFHAAHNAGEPAWAWRDSARAWTESLTHHVAKDAIYFGNADDVRKGTFAGMTLTVTLGTGKDKTYFFKP